MPYKNASDKQTQQKRIREKYHNQLCHEHGGAVKTPRGGHCKKCNAEYMKSFLKRDLRRRLLFGARERASRLQLECSIKMEDIYIPLFCPLLKIPLRAGDGKVNFASPTLDRIDAAKGYVKDNIWVISHKANRIKSNATPEEIQLVASGLSGV